MALLGVIEGVGGGAGVGSFIESRLYEIQDGEISCRLLKILIFQFSRLPNSSVIN